MSMLKSEITLYAGLAALIIVPLVVINFFVGGSVRLSAKPDAVSAQIVSAELGDVDKAYALAHVYRDGTGVKADLSKAADWYRIAAKKGHRQARVELGLLLCEGQVPPREPDEAFNLLRNAPEDSAASACLCKMYMEGQGVAQSDADAVYICGRAAHGKDPEGLRLLGSLYVNGRGVVRDMAAGGDYYAQAVAAGSAEAETFVRHQKILCGDNAAGNHAQACLFMAGFGDTAGQFRAGNAYYSGQGGLAQDRAAAAKWYRKAAEGGVIGAQLALGSMLVSGEGGKTDPDEAYAWYYVALHSKGNAKQLQRIVQDMQTIGNGLAEADKARAEKMAQEYLGKYGRK